jgi:hypothetical protein
VESYSDDKSYRKAIEIAAEVDVLLAKHSAEPHRYHSDAKRVRVMLVHGASPQSRETVRAIVDGL